MDSLNRISGHLPPGPVSELKEWNEPIIKPGKPEIFEEKISSTKTC
jgi:hypothetical protein